MSLRDTWVTLKEAASDWSDDNASRLAASLAYYSLLSLAPLLVIAVSAAGLFFGAEAAKGKVAGELGAVVGGTAATGIQSVVSHAQSPTGGMIGTVVGVLTLLFGASGVFGELKSSLNAIWEVKPKSGRGIWGEIKSRFFSFTMVLGVAFLLLVSLILTAILSTIGDHFSGMLPGGEGVWQVVNFVFSLAVITALFALIFKYVPDAEVHWKDVWLGAAFTAVLFAIGKVLLGIYLGKAAVGSAYGASGSIIALVVWVYYAAQILFMGAEFTQVSARHRGRDIQPSADAEKDEHAIEEQAPSPRKGRQAPQATQNPARS
jgi:membrane protein